MRVDFVLDFEREKKTRERKRKEKSKIDGAISNKIIKFPPIKRYGFVPYDFFADDENFTNFQSRIVIVN